MNTKPAPPSRVLLQARIKPEDLESIRARAKAAGATMSAFVRAQCLSEPVRVAAVDSDLSLAFERHARLCDRPELLPLARELSALLKERVVCLQK